MELKPGAKLGPYEILSPIGAGGMGEVWKARDTRLDRTVAIKTSKVEFSERFEREARAVAALNHPHICTLYDVGPDYLVMELIDGLPLKGPLPLEKAIEYAGQILDALDAAHRKGITHRDLKPANILVTKQGIKLLDFGLAKQAAGVGPEDVTVAALTMQGQIAGTLQYMAPEQLQAKEADSRSDIFAFGCVLYEMLMGRRAFDGANAASIIAAVMERPAPSVSDVAPAALDRVLKRCLEKDPDDRWQSARDLKAELAWIAGGGGTEGTTAAPSQSRLGKTGWIAVALVATVLLAALAFVHFREKAPVAELTRFQIPLPADEKFPLTGGSDRLEVSPDGRMLVFPAVDPGGTLHLWIRSFDSLDARVMPGIDIADTYAPPFWSPDSRSIAFLSTEHKLKKADVSGGPAQTLCDAADLVGGSWGRDGVILFAEGGRHGIQRVSAAGGTPIELTAVDPARERGHLYPTLLPDGRHFLYLRDSSKRETSGIYVGAMDAKPSGQSSKPLVVTGGAPEYYVPFGNSGNGYLLFYRQGTVLAQPFNSDKLEVSGDPVPIAEHVDGDYIGYFSASANGVLAYVPGSAGGGNARLTWFDREGKNLGTVGEPGNFGLNFGLGSLALSRDGRQAVVTRLGSGSQANKGNLWLLDLTRGGASTRFTFDAFVDGLPVFSPDGSSVVFASTRNGPGDLYRKLTSGIKDEELLLKSDRTAVPLSWSPDGRFLLYSVQTPKAKGDIGILPMDGGKPMPFQATEFNEIYAAFSPDGRWIAYGSDESGRVEVYVREFSLGSDGKPEATAKHQISNGGGVPLGWRDDGKELIYLSPDKRTVMSAEIATRPVFQASPAKALFQLSASTSEVAVTGDGKRFLAAMPVSQAGPPQFTVVQNWQAGLKK